MTAGSAAAAHLRVMTYNIRNGRGLDGKVDLGRIADVIASRSPDLVALQEVDAGRPRSGAVDQAAELAHRLGMEPRFAACISVGEAHYGIATLSRVGVIETRRLELPHTGGRMSEPRCALVTKVRWPDGLAELELVNTHLSLRPGERAAQAAALCAELGDADADVVVAGDLNCTPRSGCYRLFGRLTAALPRGPSWPSRMPVLQLDHLLFGRGVAVSDASVVTSQTARRASDHLPLVASFRRAEVAS